MTKRPEEVLPEQGIAMEAGLIEVGTQVTVEQENAERPEVGVHGREAVCNATAILLFAQWRVVEPAAIGSLVEQEAGIQENCGKENEPVPEGVQAWEGHITGADHEGYNVVAEASKHGHHK